MDVEKRTCSGHREARLESEFLMDSILYGNG